ncbi:MAG TPA: serine hydrolase domain-containing protein [Gemmatimonas sp.]|nr:serine hydrolase domain-containing protein [Gemmatimonas sp.]
MHQSVQQLLHAPARSACHRLARSLALPFLVACSSTPTTPADPDVPLGLQRTVDSIATAERIPGVVIEVRTAGGVEYVLTSGVSSLESRKRIRATDRFRVASVTKAMVATVILQLVDEGRLELTDTLQRLLPGIVPSAARITVRQLLDHTAGLPDYTNDEAFIEAVLADPGKAWTPAQLISISNRMPRLFEPGAPGQHAYSNTDYVLLGMVIEAVTRRTVAEELSARLFVPLGMTRSSYSTSPSLPAPFAQGYVDLDDAQRDIPVGTILSPTWGGAAGAVVSTAPDLSRFVDALASGRLVRPATFAAQRTPVAGSAVRFPGERVDVQYGLGVILSDGWIGHNGAIPGYEAEAHAKTGVGSIVVLLNRSTDMGASRAIFTAVRRAQFETP